MKPYKPEDLTVKQLVELMKRKHGRLHLKAYPKSKARVKFEWDE